MVLFLGTANSNPSKRISKSDGMAGMAMLPDIMVGMVMGGIEKVVGVDDDNRLRRSGEKNLENKSSDTVMVSSAAYARCIPLIVIKRLYFQCRAD